PMLPEAPKLGGQMDAGGLWRPYVRYIGAGAVAVAGLLTVLRGLAAMAGAFAAVARGLRSSGVESDRDLPPAFVFGAIALVPLACFAVPGIFAGSMCLL